MIYARNAAEQIAIRYVVGRTDGYPRSILIVVAVVVVFRLSAETRTREKMRIALSLPYNVKPVVSKRKR